MLAEDVVTKDDFVSFLKTMESNFLSNENCFENATLDSYFEAMSGWIDDTDEEVFMNMLSRDSEPIWRIFAYILDAAAMYE